jgi:hypothetical protein
MGKRQAEWRGTSFLGLVQLCSWFLSWKTIVNSPETQLNTVNENAPGSRRPERWVQGLDYLRLMYYSADLARIIEIPI